MSSSRFSIDAVGYIDGCYPDKFGIPRQPGLVESASAHLILSGEYATADAVRGLEDFSHLWLTFVFHKSPERWTPLVRPPRLGGNRKVGVFASRATHRPNRLGLSLVELLKVDTHDGISLHIRGHDLMNGTPVVDIKPYLPWAESVPDARGGFADQAPPNLRVIFSATAKASLATLKQPGLEQLITDVLAQDPRPAYHPPSERRYGVSLGQHDIGFHAREDQHGIYLEVSDITPIPVP